MDAHWNPNAMKSNLLLSQHQGGNFYKDELVDASVLADQQILIQ